MSYFQNLEHRPLKKSRLGNVGPDVYPQDPKQKECSMCNKQQHAKAYRLKVHYIKCSLVHQLPEAKLIPDRPIVRKRERSPSPPAKCQAHSMPIISAQQHMDTHIVKTSTNYKNKIDLEVAKLFYACNIPFNVAEHSQFKRS
ncbi:hypothetical protein LSH36_169g02011 [Paralvinella palmiformis]|uniref:Uncharacterized protein n=1 Tax=Paralvinella palmiformis TaxID=53620 RepID=A0AAD9N820_9ANNE|nr:hypothetical protein LSH36_169g02011 [Paralvinella palmiformis]